MQSSLELRAVRIGFAFGYLGMAEWHLRRVEPFRSSRFLVLPRHSHAGPPPLHLRCVPPCHQGDADRLLVYLTLYAHQAVIRMSKVFVCQAGLACTRHYPPQPTPLPAPVAARQLALPAHAPLCLRSLTTFEPPGERSATPRTA